MKLPKELIERFSNMARKVSEIDKELADALRKSGFPYKAKYVEMFGSDNMNPWFWGKTTKKEEAFYKTCVEEKHPWDYYVDPPEDVVL